MQEIKNTIASTSMDRLLSLMRVLNIFNGLLLGLACVFAFTIIEGSITRFFLAVYIGIFALLLLAFELRVKRAESVIKGLFGFMYTYIGRTTFLLFLGAINFGMIADSNKGRDGRTVCICVGIATVANAAFNCLVICNHPKFREPSEKRQMTQEEIIAYVKEHPELAEQALKEAEFNRMQQQAAAQDDVSINVFGAKGGAGSGGGGAAAPSAPSAYIPPSTAGSGFTSVPLAPAPAPAPASPPPATTSPAMASPAAAPAMAPAPAPVPAPAPAASLPPPLPPRNKPDDPFSSEENPFA